MRWPPGTSSRMVLSWLADSGMLSIHLCRPICVSFSLKSYKKALTSTTTTFGFWRRRASASMERYRHAGALDTDSG